MAKEKTVLYWEQIIVADNDIREHYVDVLQKLFHGDYKSSDLDLKKLRGSQIYSVRVNHTDRLLFTTMVGADGKRYLVFLEEVKNHDYQKSSFLKKGVLKAFLEKMQLNPWTEEDVISEADFLPDDGALLEEEVADNEAEEIAAQPMQFYNQHFIQLNEQQNAARAASLPLLINGGAGSGKSCVALSLLSDLINSFAKQEQLDARLLYVAQSPRLVVEMSKIWSEHPANDGRITVEFKSYSDLLSREDTRQIVSREEFIKWLTTYKNHQRQIKKSSKGKQANVPSPLEEADLAYQEFRVIAAYDKTDYMKLGARQSIFNNPHQKEELYAAWEAYCHYLHANQKVDVSLVALPENMTGYNAIIADESQDFSHLQLQKLFHLAQGQIAFCYDSHQSLFDTYSKRPYLLQLPTAPASMDVINLQGSYRCPTSVLHFVNHHTKIKLGLTGGTLDKREATEIGLFAPEKPGDIHWFTEIPEDLAEQQQTTCAVVTTVALKKEAYQKFKTPLVFTVEEIKGLEYPHIIAYQLWSDPIFLKANEALKGQASSSKTPIHRAKHSGGEEYAPPFNHVHTACTRALEQLIIIQNNPHQLSHLLQEVRQGLSKVNSEPSLISKEEQPSDTQWLQEAQRLVLREKMEQAKNIVVHTLKKTESDFESLCAMWLKKEALPSVTVEQKKAAPVKKAEPVTTTVTPATAPQPPAVQTKANPEAEPTKRKKRRLVEPVEIAKEAPKAALQVKSTAPAPLDKADWMAKAHQLALNEKISKAREIMVTRLGYSEEIFERLLQAWNKKVEDTLKAQIEKYTTELQSSEQTLSEIRLCLCILLLGNNINKGSATSELSRNIGLRNEEDILPALKLLKEKLGNDTKIMELFAKTIYESFTYQDKQASLFYLCCTMMEGRAVLSILFTKGKRFLEAPIPHEVIYQPLLKVSAFTSLIIIGEMDSVHLFQKLIKTRDEFTKNLTLQTLRQSINGLSVFALLISLHSIFISIFEKNSELLELITIDDLFDKKKKILSTALFRFLRSQLNETQNVEAAQRVSEKAGVTLFATRPDLLMQITGKILFTYDETNKISVFDCFCYDTMGIRFLNRLFTERPELMSQITIEYLTHLPLYYLSLEPNGAYLLHKILKANPELKKQLTLDLLLYYPARKSKTILFELFMIEAFDLLIDLFENNETLTKSLPPKLLSEPHDGMVNKDPALDTLYFWISESNDSAAFKLLIIFFKQNHQLAKHTCKADEKGVLTPILAQYADEELLNKLPKITQEKIRQLKNIKETPVYRENEYSLNNSLFETTYNNVRNNCEAALFTLLNKDNTTLGQLLAKINIVPNKNDIEHVMGEIKSFINIDNNAKLFTDVLYEPFDHNGTSYTLFYIFCATPIGISCLHILFNKCPNKVQGPISAELFIPINQVSALMLLLKFILPSEHNILTKLFTHKTVLASYLSPEIMRHSVDGISVLCLLARHSSLCAQIFAAHPALSECISLDDLRGETDVASSPIYFLLNGESSCLGTVLSIQPNLLHNITQEQLFTPFKKDRVSLFTLFAATKNGFNYLNQIMNSNPALFSAISATTLTDSCELVESALHSFHQDRANSSLLNKIIKLQPTLINELGQHLMSSNEEQIQVLDSIIYTENMALLLCLLNEVPELAKRLPKDILTKEREQKVDGQDATQDNLYYWLTVDESLPSLQFLFKLFKLNPELATHTCIADNTGILTPFLAKHAPPELLKELPESTQKRVRNFQRILPRQSLTLSANTNGFFTHSTEHSLPADDSNKPTIMTRRGDL